MGLNLLWCRGAVRVFRLYPLSARTMFAAITAALAKVEAADQTDSPVSYQAVEEYDGQIIRFSLTGLPELDADLSLEEIGALARDFGERLLAHMEPT
jgi:hypothetical protein